MTKIHDLAALGQSVWLDYIRRAFIESGELQDLIDGGVSGITSNPALFEKAIAGSADYDRVLKDLATKGRLPGEIYESLAIEDIQRAADMLRPVYSSSNGADGYASLEVNPELANNAEGTIDEARRLFAALDRPNVMIKVPATPAGVAAVETLIGEGINVNVTLMFSLEHYDAVAEAYIRGLERFAGSGGYLGREATVASFFRSRIDTAVDRAGLTRPLTSNWTIWRMRLLRPLRARRPSPMPGLLISVSWKRSVANAGRDWLPEAPAHSAYSGPAPAPRIPNTRTPCMWILLSARTRSTPSPRRPSGLSRIMVQWQ
jgi:transaldolase